MSNPSEFDQPPFRNESKLDFKDISSEKYRVYKFAGGDSIRIENPLRINVSKSGGHRIFDKSGMSHYIPPGWIHLRWEAKAKQPNFVM